MPQFIPVQSLYSACLVVVYEHLHNGVHKSGAVEKLRKLIQSSLHAGIREHLVHLSTTWCRQDVYILLDLLNVLLDKSIKELDHSGGNYNFWLRTEQCSAFFSTLEQCEATGLQDLTVKVRLDPRRGGDLEAVSSANLAFHRVLRNGLAENLRSLVLRSVCDNEILKLLGRHCVHLRHLDATSSWLVNDVGLHHLCFKDPESSAVAADGYCVDNTEWFSKVQPSDLNICCRTLQEVRIQDTNTSEIGVAMLLSFIPNLRSLGGFIYYRNVGDAIVSLAQQHQKGKLLLNLTDLWDTCLPPDKAELVADAAPKLMSLYTRGSWLHSVGAFPCLTSLTIDFDFVDYAVALENYVTDHGQKLRRLVLVDQMHSVDLGMLAEFCPNLEELGAKLSGGWCGPAGVMLPHLSTCRIRVATMQPLRSLLVHASQLMHLEVILEEESYGEEVEILDDSVISQSLSENPHLEHLRVLVFRSECYLTALSVHLFIGACPVLCFLGDLQAWFEINELVIEHLVQEIIDRNLDLVLSYRGNLLPQRKRCLIAKAS